MEKQNRPVTRKNNIVQHEVDGELLIYDLIVDKAFCLNGTSAQVWRACDGARTIDEIAGLIGSEEVTWLALDQLRSEGLLDNEPSVPAKFAGMTRRQVIQRAGLAAMVALPIITSLTVPQSVYAQTSGLPIGSACTVSSQCVLNNQNLRCCRAGVCANGTGGCAPG